MRSWLVFVRHLFTRFPGCAWNRRCQIQCVWEWSESKFWQCYLARTKAKASSDVFFSPQKPSQSIKYFKTIFLGKKYKLHDEKTFGPQTHTPRAPPPSCYTYAPSGTLATPPSQNSVLRPWVIRSTSLLPSRPLMLLKTAWLLVTLVNWQKRRRGEMQMVSSNLFCHATLPCNLPSPYTGTPVTILLLHTVVVYTNRAVLNLFNLKEGGGGNKVIR